MQSEGHFLFVDLIMLSSFVTPCIFSLLYRFQEVLSSQKMQKKRRGDKLAKSMLANGENNVFLFVNVDCCGRLPDRGNGRQRKGSALTGTRIAEGRTGNEAARVNRRSAFPLKHFTKEFPGSGKQRKKFEKGEAIP